MVVGITGGIASGKTTAARMLADLGATVVDADQIGRAVVEDTPEVLQALVGAFGRGVLAPSGALDRRELGRLAFASAEQRDKLNAIVHPSLLEALRAQVEREESRHPGRPVVVDAALLVEWMLDPPSAARLPRFDAVVVVTADASAQEARLGARGLDPDEARQWIRAQLGPDARAKHADYVLHNNGTLAQLKQRVAELWAHIHGDRAILDGRASGEHPT